MPSSAFVAAVVAFEQSIPVLLLVWCAFSVWAVVHQLAWVRLIEPANVDFQSESSGNGNVSAGWAIVFLDMLLTAVWMCSWIYCHAVRFWIERRYRVPVVVFRWAMQADPPGRWGAHGELIPAFFFPDGFRICPGGCGHVPDRHYHCTRIGKCLPLYDHFCDWLRVPVCEYTILPWCTVVLGCPLHALFVVVVSCWAMSTRPVAGVKVFLPAALIGSILVAAMAIIVVFPFVRKVVLQNKVHPETRRGLWFAVRVEDEQGAMIRFFDLEGENPWDLKWWRNVKQALWRRTQHRERGYDSAYQLGPLWAIWPRIVEGQINQQPTGLLRRRLRSSEDPHGLGD